MSYTRNQTIDNTPNTGDVFEQQQSFNPDLFKSEALHGGGEAGYLSFKSRSVDDIIVEYEPQDTALNTMIMLTGGRQTTNSVVHEWAEDDWELPNELEGLSNPPNADDVVNNVSGGTTYVPAADDVKFVVAPAEAAKARIKFKVRYANGTGGWSYAVIKAIEDESGNKALILKSITGDNLPVAAAENTKLELLETAYGSDLNYDPQPRGANPKMYYTYLQKMAAFGSWTERSENEGNMFDQQMRAMEQSFKDMNRQLEDHSLYGERGKHQLPNGDWVYTTPGLYDSTKEFNYHTSEMTTGGIFDANKFKNALYNAVQFNFGAESGGPQIRMGFMDGRFSNYLDRAFEDKQRFYGNEFVGGVKVNRFEISDGIIDFIRLPRFERRHPIPGGSLRDAGSTPRGVLMVVPIGETVERVEFENEGLRSDEYILKGGDEEKYFRTRYTCGLVHKLRQYSFVLEEVAE